MTSKKHINKLKQQYPQKKKRSWVYLDENAQKDREIILNFLKINANNFVSSKDIQWYNLYYSSPSHIHMNIEYLREHMDITIIGKPGQGYMYIPKE